MVLIEGVVLVLVVAIIAFTATRIAKASRKAVEADTVVREVKALRRLVSDIETMARSSENFEPILSSNIIGTINRFKREIE